MAKIGIIAPPTIGHINPFISIAKELKARGHHPVFFNVVELKEKILAEGLEFYALGEKVIPKDAMNALHHDLAKLDGIDAMVSWQKINAKLVHVMLWALPKAIKECEIDFLLVDQSDASGGSVAEYLKIPFITIAIGNNLQWEKNVPPVFFNWAYGSTPAHFKRNEEGILIVQKAFLQITDLVNAYRKRWGLIEYKETKDIFPVSSIAQIAQIPTFLDFERKEVSEKFYNVGMLRDGSDKEIPFPYEKLNGKPIIFASLGTVVNNRSIVFHEIAAACQHLDFQLIISCGSKSVPPDMKNLPGNPLVVAFAPQMELMKKAKLCITHAGLNTVLDALYNGVPLIAIPVSFDQPGTAARIKWHKVGDVVSLHDVFVNGYLKERVEAILNEPQYYHNAQLFREKLKSMNGLDTACDIIEKEIEINLTVKN